MRRRGAGFFKGLAKVMRSARATIAGFEMMPMFWKGRFRFWIEAIGGRDRGALHQPAVRSPRNDGLLAVWDG
jgi:hypothetical protein